MQEDNRDITNDINEITARLGEPDAVYQSNPRSMMWRFLIGAVIVIAAGVLHYFVWTGGIPMFKLRHIKLWILIIAGMFIGPGAGLYLIYFAVRGLKMWVLEYGSGLFVWHRGVVYALPWEEITSITFKGLPNSAKLNHSPAVDNIPGLTTYDLTKSTRRLFGTTLLLTRDDGAEVSISSILKDFPLLGERIQQQVFEQLFPDIWEKFTNDGVLTFGPLSCNQTELIYADKSVLWTDLSEIERAGDKYHIKLKKKSKIWNKVEVDKIVNLHLFMAIATHMLPPEEEEE
jgi:hypothetical protein